MAEEGKTTNSESDVTAPLKNPAAGAAPRLAAVVVTYNRLDQLKITVARLLDSAADVLDRLVVVDNASTDDTARWLAEQVGVCSGWGQNDTLRLGVIDFSTCIRP